jgi:subtilisin family serine protease
MKQSSRLRVLALLTLVTGACSDVPTGAAGLGPDARTSATSTSTATVTGFGFLPPTVKNPAPIPGTFDATRTPTVRVVCTAPSGPSCPTVATFAMGSGANGIRVDADDQSYKVLWQVPSSLMIGSGTYRLEVLDGARIIGRGDLWVARTTQDANRVAGPYVAVVAGKPILIKFRITNVPVPIPLLPGSAESPAVAAIPDSLPDLRNSDFIQDGSVLVTVSIGLLRIAPDARVGDVNALLAETGAIIIGGSHGVPAQTAGLLVVRFPTTTRAALAEALAGARARAFVLDAVPDAVASNLALPRATNGPTLPEASDWIWQLASGDNLGGNWGFEFSRIPQVWNLNEVVRRDGVATRVGVWEPDAFEDHIDLGPYEARVGRSSIALDNHSVAVAGVIGALHGNGGIDGVTPFARLVVGNYSTKIESQTFDFITASAISDAIRRWVEADVRVLNISFGFKYEKLGDPEALANAHGAMVRDALATQLAEGNRIPLIIVAAGNESTVAGVNLATQTRDFPSRLSGAFQNAAITHQVAAILPVEAVGLKSGGRLGRRFDSSVGGRISAPGDEVLLLARGNAIARELSGGTSFAAPFVAGVAAYLYSLHPTLPQPTLTSNPVADLLVRTAVTVGNGTAPMIDAFEAVMESDVLAGSDRARRGLVDVDDGTLDGNTRVDVQSQVENLSQVVGSDGLATMADFRRWRDWALDAEESTARVLDGRESHPKRDLNGDGLVSSVDRERIYPRGDFNGDGELSFDKTAPIPDALGGGNLTDLEVFQRRFSDPLYNASELSNLVLSGDIHVATDLCILGAGERLRIRLVQPELQYTKEVIAPAGAGLVVLTAPAPLYIDYTVELAKLASNGTVLGAKTSTVSLGLGSDRLVRTGCDAFRITNEFLPRGKVGFAYSAQMEAVNNTGPITWSNPDATLPAGLRINAQTGLISGTPTVAVVPSVFVSIQAVSGDDATVRRLGIRIDPALTITTTNLPVTDSGATYATRLRVSGASTAPTWRLVSGALPNGITLSSTGEIGGTALQVGTFTFRVEASAGEEVAATNLTIVVRPPLFTVTVQIRMVNFFSGTVAKVTSDPLGLTRLDTGGVCEYSSSRDFGLLVLCRVSQRRGSTAEFKLETLSIFRWFDATGRCTTGTTCNVLFDDPNPLIKSRNLSLDLNI